MTITWKQIASIAQLRGIRLNELSSLIGVNVGHLRRLRGGQHSSSPELLSRAINVLRLDSDQSLPDGWTKFSRNDSEQTRAYNSEFGAAHGVLTISRSLDSYLQEEDMLEWSNRIWTGIDDWESYKLSFLPYAKGQIRARDHGKFAHRLVCPWRMFATAGAMIPSGVRRRDRLLSNPPETYSWLDRVRNGIGRYGDVCSVFPVRDFSSMCNAITARLPQISGRWTKLCIIDRTRIVIHVDESYFLSSYSASIVQTLQTEIEAIVKLFEPSFLPNSQVNLTRFRECSYHLSNRIEKLLINQSELESSYEFLVVFKHMLEKKDILRPDSYVHKIAKRDRHLYRQKS